MTPIPQQQKSDMNKTFLKSLKKHKVWVSWIYMHIHNCIMSTIYSHFCGGKRQIMSVKVCVCDCCLQQKAPTYSTTPICLNTLAYYDNLGYNYAASRALHYGFYLDRLFAYFSSVYLAIIEYHWPVYAYMYCWNRDKKFSTMMKECRNVFPEYCQGNILTFCDLGDV